MKKRIFVVFLALVIVMAFSSFAFANDELDAIMEHVKLDEKNTFDIRGDEDVDGTYISSYVTVPAKGKITVRFESKSKAMFTGSFVTLYANDEEKVITVFNTVTPKYSKSSKLYYYQKTFTVEKGDYVVGLESHVATAKPMYYYVKYKPSLGTTAITKLTAKKRGFTVKYKEASNATGYQIRYTRNKSMTKAAYRKTTELYKTVSKIKTKKRYYVQVRAYRTLKVDGKTKTYYSDWSAKKSVRTK